jgi:hypothetical protein
MHVVRRLQQPIVTPTNYVLASLLFLPTQTQALINTALPTFPGTASGRMHYSSAHSSHHQQHQHGTPAAGSTPAAAGGSIAGRAAGGSAGHAAAAARAGLTPQGQAQGMNPNVQVDGLMAGFPGMQAQHMASTGFATPLSALSGLYRSGSPALAAAIGAQQSLLHAAGGVSMGQAALLGQQGQQMTLFSCPDPNSAADIYSANPAGLLAWPYGAAGLIAAGQQHAAALSAGMPLLQPPQQVQQSHYIGMPQQLYLQQPVLGAGAAPLVTAQLQHQLSLQQLGLARLPSGLLVQQQQLQQGDGRQQQQQQQQQWLTFLQPPQGSMQ